MCTTRDIDNKKYLSISFIGHRVSTDNEFAIETHIINQDLAYKDNLDIEIEFIDFIRDNIVFDNLDSLKKQIKKDIMQIEKIL